MPYVIIPSDVPTLDGDVAGKAWKFIEKLRQDDTAPGLRIKSLKGAADRRIRTGRVNDNYRAVLVKLTGSDEEPRYIFLGIFKHDVANEHAANLVFRRNPQTSAAEVVRVDLGQAVPLGGAEEAIEEAPTGEPQAAGTGATALPLLQAAGVTFDHIIGLGIDARTAYDAINAADEESLLTIAYGTSSPYEGDALLLLAGGASVDKVRELYELNAPEASAGEDTDDDLIAALDHPVARMQFAYLTDDVALREAIEHEDFALWRVFLHPEQRAYVAASTKGPVRLSGGAGTGKTVVLLHRARHLHRRNPAARIFLTTYTTTLATALRSQLLLLDPNIVVAKEPGDPGVYVGTLDAAARRLVVRAEDHGLDVRRAATSLLGRVRGEIVPSTDPGVWEAVLRGRGQDLPAQLRTPAFLDAEYSAVIVPQRIATRDEYLRVRRPGRGIALGRAQRNAVWEVIEAYREMAAGVGTTNFDEKAMTVAMALDTAAENGGSRVADHVLVDEAQDLGPAHLHLLRALVARDADDLLLAEDSQQRIYAPRTVLSRYGIFVTGRSRRLQLNYRTTSQNLGYATAVLAGHPTVDLEDSVVDDSGLRSARSGPPPTVLGCETLEAAYDAVAREIDCWLSAGVAHETIAVLVWSGNEAVTLTRQLAGRGIPAQHVRNQDTPGADRVVVMTRHRSKGMEFRHVVVFGATAESTRVAGRVVVGDPAEALQRERSLLYVATTRARERVVVVWHGTPSELLPEARPKRAAFVGQVSVQNQVMHEDLAREMHDGVGYAFTEIITVITQLEREVRDNPAVQEKLARLRTVVRRGHAELRTVLEALRTGAEGLADVSFDDLGGLLQRLRNQGFRITSSFDVADGETASRILTRTCYRIVQESVSNALAHAESQPIDIVLRGAPGTGVTIVVNNPLPVGASGPQTEGRPHSGIAGMRDRAESLGGTFSAGAVSGRFVVDARIPWERREGGAG
ncbi:UvrD-helicase domain-containing protein [Promicromonospora sp. MEB111]|uniref:UvrD-helicase domain-containing protein n=1 Tax=Promicromonospora sp. MEB111 TaxID=3040301 RepID=UPI00254F7626|nr:UvrD-helicase domain-containing protein [Promicromonospora sp. MEB111]